MFSLTLCLLPLNSILLKLCLFQFNVLFNTFLFTVMMSDIWYNTIHIAGARCSSVARAFAHGAMGRRVDPSWSGLIELFLVRASAPRLV